MDRELEIRTCCLYLKTFHVLIRKQPSSQMELTPLHTALINGDMDMIDRILEEVGEPEVVETVLNCPLVNLQRQQVRAKNMPPTLIYIARIAHLLSHEDIRRIGTELETRHHTPSHVNIMSRMTEAFYLELPLFLACASGSRLALETLIKHGACLDGRDSKEENVFHNLVRLSEKAPRTAVDMYKFIIDELCVLDIRVNLLHAENRDGRRPLDLAGKLCLPEMLLAIINTDGVYRYPLLEYGLVRLVRYDLTDYESDQAQTHKSILYHLTNMDEAQLSRALGCQLLSSEPFHSWIKTKFIARQGLMRSFIVFWMIHTIFFVLTLTSFIHGSINDAYLIFTILHAVVYLAVEFFHSKQNVREIRDALKGTFIYRHVPVTFTFVYRFFQIAFCVCVLFSAVCYPFRCSNPTFILSTFVISTMLGCLSFLFFMQIQSNVGHLLIILQKVVYDTSFFLFMMFLIFLAFASGLFLLHSDMELEACRSDNNSVSYSNNCDKDESFPKDFSEALYETVLLMFTVMAPRDIHFKCSHIPGMAALLYILLLLIISIILVNLLIAIMTQRIEEISRMREGILKLERVSIVLYMEERLKTKILMAALNFWQKFVKKIPFNQSYPGIFFKRRPKPSFVKAPSGRVYLDLVETLIEDKDARRYGWRE